LNDTIVNELSDVK